MSYLKAKSIHIFGWPFRIGKKEIKIFKKQVKETPAFWMEKEMDYTKITEVSELCDAYMLYQYLSAAARDVFFKKKDKICTVYEYPIREKLYYEITSFGGFSYSLPIEKIELHLYNFGVGIIFLHVLNYDEKAGNAGAKVCGVAEDIADIKRINDAGRRMMAPILARDGDTAGSNPFLVCAEKLGIRWEGCPGKTGETAGSVITDFRENVTYVMNHAQDETAKQRLSQPADFLLRLLNGNLKKDGPYKISVDSRTDDRMFVMCMIRDEALSEAIRCSTVDLDLLYSVLYVDYDSTSCEDADMRNLLLDESVYRRWCGLGTLYGITDYSMVCITTDKEKIIDNTVIHPYLAEYPFLVSLVYAQKMGIEWFSELAEKQITLGWKKIFARRKTLPSRWIADLQKRYLLFKNQILILSFSWQEQGAELYRLLQKQMMIDQDRAMLDEQMQGIYEMENVKSGNFLAVLGTILAIITLVFGDGFLNFW